jgi:sulfur-carrier protein
MKVRVRLFAVARQLAGADSVEITLPDEATAADVRCALVEQWSVLAPLVPHVMLAIGSSYAADTAKIPLGADLACIPPVSGG